MPNVGKQQNGVTVGRWLLRGLSRREVLLTSTTHARMPRLLVSKQSGIVGTITTSLSYVASRDTSSGTASNQQGKAGKGVHGQSHGQTPIHQQQSTGGPAQYTRSKTTGMAPASATPQASGYKTASKAVVTETELVAPEPSTTQNDDDFVYIRMPRERMATVDNGLNETVQHQVSQSAGPHNAAPVIHPVPVQLPAPASQHSCGDFSTILYARGSVLQPGGSGDTSVDTVETEPHLEALTQHVAGRLVVPGASAAAEVKLLMDSGSGTTAISEELVEALQRQPGMTQTALTQAFVGPARVVTSLGQDCDIDTQSCLHHVTIETPWGPVRFTMPFIVLPVGGDVVIIGQKTLREKLGIDVMAPLKASALKAQGRQDRAGMEFTAPSVGEPNDGAVLRAAMAVTAFVPGVTRQATWTMRSH